LATVLGADDVASAPTGEEGRQRGIAGIFFLYKVAGAAAAAGLDLQSVARVTHRTAACVRSMGIALSPCIVPPSATRLSNFRPGTWRSAWAFTENRVCGRDHWSAPMQSLTQN
jgi:phosphoenolpyruvate---glycerone phosphotransferase subunit DhaK